MSDFSERDFATPDSSQPSKKGPNPFLIPGAIVMAGLLVAGAVFFTKDASQQASDSTQQIQAGVQAPDVRPVTSDDHVRGNPNAEIVIIEYSDFECPFCGQFHNTMKRIIDKYGKDGTVAWVYRQFPIEQLHKQAWREAIASECVADIGGHEAFWQFADLLFANNNGGNDGLDLTKMSDFAEEAGVSREAFNSCLESERTRPLVQEDYDEATSGAGGRGTPHNVIIARGQSAAVPGAQPYEAMDSIIQSILNPNNAAAQESADETE